MKKVLSFLVAILVLAYAASGQAEKRANGNTDTTMRKPLISERYVGVGLGYVAGLSENSPYRAGVNFHDVFGHPLWDRRLVVEGQLDFDIRFSHNRDWNTRAYNVWKPTRFAEFFSFMSVDFTVGAYPVIVNNDKFAAMAGPMVGVVFIQARSASGEIMLGGRHSAAKLCYGLNASFFLGKHIAASAQYFMTPVSEVSTTSPAFPVTFNALRICATYYYLSSSSWLYKRMARRKALTTGGGSSQ